MKKWLCKVNYWDGSMYYREGETYDMPDNWKPPKPKKDMPEKFELIGVFKPPKEKDKEPEQEPEKEPEEEPEESEEESEK